MLAICVLVSLTYTLIESKQSGWTALPILVGGSSFAIAALLFIQVEKRSKNPMLPLKFFTSPTFAVANVTACFYNYGLYGLLLVLTLYAQNVQKISASMTGLLFLPLGLTFLLTSSLIAGRVTARSGPRLPLAFGTMGCCLGVLIITWVARNSNPVFLISGLIVFGSGMGLTMPAMTAAALSSVQVAQAGIGSAALNASRQVGGVLGPIIAGTLVTGASFLMGMQSVLLIISGGFFLSFVLSLIFVPRGH